MKIIDLLNKIANGEIEDETMISCNGFFNNIVYRDKNLYWVHRNEIVETKYITEAIQNNYEFKIYTELEILEEEKKIPEKLEIYEDEEGHYFIDKHCKKIYITCDEVNFIVEEFNQLIDYLKSKGE